MGDMGVIFDSYGNTSNYFTIGFVIGYGASAGTGFSITTDNAKINDFSGYSDGVLFQLPGKFLKNVSTEVYANLTPGATNEYFGDKYSGGGFNLGVGKVYGVYHSYTFLFIAPPPEIWCRPGRR